MSTVHYDTTFDLLRNLAFLSKKQQFCKHEGACTSNAVRGVVRGSVIGYAVKASISIALGLFFKRLYKHPRKFLEILLSKDTYSFSMFLGAFAGTYKIVQCFMRLIRQKEDGINAAVAGACAGLTLVFDSESRWLDIALYMFARAVASILSHYFGAESSHHHHEVVVDTVAKSVVQRVLGFIKRIPKTIWMLIVSNADVLAFSALVGVLIVAFIYEPWNLSTSYYRVFTRMEESSKDEHVAHNFRVAYRKGQEMSIDPNDLSDRVGAPRVPDTTDVSLEQSAQPDNQ